MLPGQVETPSILFALKNKEENLDSPALFLCDLGVVRDGLGGRASGGSSCWRLNQPNPSLSSRKKAKSGKKITKELEKKRKAAEGALGVCRVVHHEAWQAFPVGNPSRLRGCSQIFLQGEAQLRCCRPPCPPHPRGAGRAGGTGAKPRGAGSGCWQESPDLGGMAREEQDGRARSPWGQPHNSSPEGFWPRSSG